MRILFILLLLAVLNGNAQEHPMGIKIGGNISNLSGDGTDNLSSMVNFHAGFFMEIDAAKDFKIQPELLFSVYGFKLDSEANTSNVRLNYIILPVMAKYFISENLSFDAGPQVGLLVTAKNGTGSLADVKSDFYDRDFGVNVGASLVITDKLSTSVRGYFGLTDVTAVDSNNFNRSFQIALQFKLN